MPEAGGGRLPVQSVRRNQPPACVLAALARGHAESLGYKSNALGRLGSRSLVHSIIDERAAAAHVTRDLDIWPGRAFADDGLCARARQQRSRRIRSDPVRRYAFHGLPAIPVVLLRAVSDRRFT